MAEGGPEAGPLLAALLRAERLGTRAPGAAVALARSGWPGAQEALVALLEREAEGGASSDAAGALALLGDPGAVPHLIAAAAPGDRSEPRRAARQAARERAVLALGAFTTAEAEAALEAAALFGGELAPAARIASFRQGGDVAHLEALEALLAEDPLALRPPLLDALAATGHPRARALAQRGRAAWEQRLEER